MNAIYRFFFGPVFYHRLSSIDTKKDEDFDQRLVDDVENIFHTNLPEPTRANMEVYGGCLERIGYEFRTIPFEKASSLDAVVEKVKTFLIVLSHASYFNKGIGRAIVTTRDPKRQYALKMIRYKLPSVSSYDLLSPKLK